MLTPDALTPFACPRCAGSLERSGDVPTCTGCGQEYPPLGRLPCLVPDPGLWRAQWLTRLQEYLMVTEGRLRELEREAASADLMPRTRRRVLLVKQTLEQERGAISARLSKLREGAVMVPPSAFPARPEQPGSLAALKYYENIFRDWAWGDRESRESLELVRRAATQPLGRLAVYGVGAGRLSIDVHSELGGSETYALDLNPMPLMVAEELLHGDTVRLTEFPVAPHSENDVAVAHELQLSREVPDGFRFLFADALRPPFAPGALDTVLTPWFVDAAGADLRDTAAAVNRVLRPGGTWINMGPLRFEGALSRVYTIEEVYDIVAASAFDVVSRLRGDVPYFDSPRSGSRRIETVFCFAARKTRDVEPRAASSGDAPWIVDTRLPIPATPELANLRRASVFTIGVIGMVDGRRSIADIAAALAQQWRADPRALEDQLRTFFQRLPGA